MQYIESLIAHNILFAWVILAVAFYIMAKCADLFVDNAVIIANKFNIPRLVIGIVLVSFATTAPELSVSLMAAIRGNPEMALGNAIGSVITDDGLALGLAGIVSLSPIIVLPIVLKTSGIFLISIEIIAFLFVVFDKTLNRWEGVVLVLLFAGYVVFLYKLYKSGKMKEDSIDIDANDKVTKSLVTIFALFFLAAAGIIFSAEFVVTSATAIARAFHIPEAVIALTLVALGTSIPEVVTCVTAARKNEGAIAVGNIIGADILNICWVAGASAIANDLTLGQREIAFMYPSMFIIVGAMLLMLWHKYRLTKTKGWMLLGLYAAYIGSFFVFYI